VVLANVLVERPRPHALGQRRERWVALAGVSEQILVIQAPSITGLAGARQL
jgi:hypothetical protein